MEPRLNAWFTRSNSSQ